MKNTPLSFLFKGNIKIFRQSEKCRKSTINNENSHAKFKFAWLFSFCSTTYLNAFTQLMRGIPFGN